MKIYKSLNMKSNTSINMKSYKSINLKRDKSNSFESYVSVKGKMYNDERQNLLPRKVIYLTI